MATTKKSLTDATVRNLKTPGTYSAGTPRGLFLVVTAGGTKSWRMRYWVDGKEFVHTLGHFPTLSLAEARKSAEEEKAQIKLGFHPKERKQAAVAAKKAEQALTFEAVAQEFVDHTKVVDEWAESTIKGHTYALKTINREWGTVPVSKVEVEHIKAIITHYQGKRTAQRFGSASSSACSTSPRCRGM